MTYRQEIQSMISELQAKYDKIEYLRDQSGREEQILLNQVRGMLPTVWDVLQKLDNNLSDELANSEL